MTKLFIVSTPIGNLQDISTRAISTLQNADLIICENTLKSKVLLDHLNITSPQLTSYNDSSDNKSRTKLIQKISDCKNACLISDAGTPLISDPGYKLIQQCYENNLEVDIIPGATALIAALTLSGLPTNQFTFLGFIAPTKQKRSQQLQAIAKLQMTAILYETPQSVVNLLQELLEIYGAINIAVCKEITKIHQKCYRGSIQDVLHNMQKDPIRGEYVIVIEPIKITISIEQLVDKYAILKPLHTQDISRFIEQYECIRKNEAYTIALQIKRSTC